MTQAPLLLAENLTAGYGPVTVLRDVSLVAREGDLVTVLGANGSGKSTLLSAIVGLLPPRAGRVVVRRRGDHRARPRGDRPPAPGAGPRRAAAVRADDGRRQPVARRPLPTGEPPGDGTRNWTGSSSLFPVLRERARLPAASLSGGQQQMLAIGRALMAEPKMLLLDEPSLGLAPLVTRQLFDTLRVLHSTGVSILLVEQNARMALELADRAYVMERGSVTVEGPAAEMLEDERVQAAYLGLGPGAGTAP